MKKKICSFITRFGGTMAYQPEEPEEVKMMKKD